MDPINYQIDVQNPFQAGLQGYQQGLAINALQQQLQAAEVQRQAQLKLQQDMYKLSTKADLTGEDIARFTLQNPQLSEQYSRSSKMLDESQKQTALKQGMSVFGPLLAGKKDLAISNVDELINANKNSGNVDEVNKLQSMKQLIETNDKAAMVSMAPQLAAIMGPEKFAENMKAIGGERAEQELQPTELKKKAAELGLTNAQTNRAIVEGKKTSAETAKILLELESLKKTGGIKPDQIFEQEDKLRKEYTNLTSTVRDVQASYQRVLASENTPAGDIALIFNYMKMLDPGSVVREGEFATAANAGGIPDRVWNIYNKALSGERLAPHQRDMFSNQAKSLYEGSQKQEQEIRKGMGRIADNYGLRKENIFYSPEGLATPQKQTAPGTMPTGFRVLGRE